MAVSPTATSTSDSRAPTPRRRACAASTCGATAGGDGRAAHGGCSRVTPPNSTPLGQCELSWYFGQLELPGEVGRGGGALPRMQSAPRRPGTAGT